MRAHAHTRAQSKTHRNAADESGSDETSQVADSIKLLGSLDNEYASLLNINCEEATYSYSEENCAGNDSHVDKRGAGLRGVGRLYIEEKGGPDPLGSVNTLPHIGATWNITLIC